MPQTERGRRDFLRVAVGAAAGAAAARCSRDDQPAAPGPEPSRPTLPVRGIQAAWNERMKRQGSHALASSPEEAWFTLADVTRMRNAGATCLEIHQIGLPDLMPVRGVPNEPFFAGWVDHWVDWCSQNHLDCILTITGCDARADWAIYLSLVPWLWEGLRAGPTNKAEYDAVIRDFFDLDVANQGANRAAFIALWAFIAHRYRDNPYVRFSIMNEPFCLVDIPDGAAASRLSESYSAFMEQIVDGIRGAGATQKVHVDKPFLWDSSGRWVVRPVNRDNIVWESHQSLLPAFGGTTLELFKAGVDGDVRRFVDEFQKPLFIGEYGIEPILEIRKTFASIWKSVISGQVAYLDSLPLAGRQFHSVDNLYGEYSLFAGDSDLTAEESDWIVQTVLASG
jgi:hypothetical protein